MLQVKVNALDVEYGIPRSHNGCPIALAFRRCGFKDVWVFETCVSVKDGRTTVWYYPVDSEAMTAFVNAFDKSERVSPQTFSFTKSD